MLASVTRVNNSLSCEACPLKLGKINPANFARPRLLNLIRLDYILLAKQHKEGSSVHGPRTSSLFTVAALVMSIAVYVALSKLAVLLTHVNLSLIPPLNPYQHEMSASKTTDS
jgi:hypothetical protein